MDERRRRGATGLYEVDERPKQLCVVSKTSVEDTSFYLSRVQWKSVRVFFVPWVYKQFFFFPRFLLYKRDGHTCGPSVSLRNGRSSILSLRLCSGCKDGGEHPSF